MALAIKFQELIDRGEVRDYADLARLGYVTRARITQIMNLLNLAPGIQEQILAASDDAARPAFSERNLRRLASVVQWSEQRRLFGGLDFLLALVSRLNVNQRYRMFQSVSHGCRY